MTEANSAEIPVLCPRCGEVAFASGHSVLVAETPAGGVLVTQSVKAWFTCPCGCQSETAISQSTGRLYLVDPSQLPRRPKHDGRLADRGKAKRG